MSLGCVGRVLGLVLLAGLLWTAWEHGPNLRERVEQRFGIGLDRTEPSPELADAALARYEELVEGKRDEVRLTGAETESVLRHRLEGFLPAGVSSPTVAFEDAEATLGFRVATNRLPALPDLDQLMEILPDTVRVGFSGVFLTLESGEAVFVVRRIEAAAVPLPRRLHARILEALGLGGREDLPPATVPVPLPAELRSAYIHRSRLVLTARR